MHRKPLLWAIISICFLGLSSSISFGQQENWVPGPNPPRNAIVGGHISDTPNPVYICRASHSGNLHAGKAAFYNGRWSCFIGNGGAEQKFDSFEILTGDSAAFSWSGNLTNRIPDNAVVGGHISDTPNPVYICRASHSGNLHPGKAAFYSGRWACYIGNGGAEQKFESYEVLQKKPAVVEAPRPAVQDKISTTADKASQAIKSVLNPSQTSTPAQSAAPASISSGQTPPQPSAQTAPDAIPAVVSSAAVPYEAEEALLLDSLAKGFDSADASIAMEGLRVIAGSGNSEIEKSLSKALAPYFILPSEATRGDLAKFRPLLMQMLAVAGATASSASAFDSAWEETVSAASIGSEEGTRVGLALASQHRSELASQQARLVKIAQQVKALPDQRDPGQERKKLQAQHQNAIKTVRQATGGAKPATTSTPPASSWGYKLIKTEAPPANGGGYNQETAARGTYSVNGNETSWEYNDDIGMGAWKTSLHWRLPKAIIPGQPTEFWISGDASGKGSWMRGGIAVTYGGELASWWVAGVRKGTDAREPMNQEDRYSLTFANPDALLSGIRQGKKPSYIMSVRDIAKMAEIIESGNGIDNNYYGTPSTVPEVQREIITQASSFSDRYVPRQVRVEVWCPGRAVQLAVYTYEWSNGVDTNGAGPLTEVSDPTDGEKSQRMQEIEANIKIIQMNLSRDEQDMAKEIDPSRRAALQFRILQARSDIQAEQDLKTSIQTGQLVHTRSPFDDYAHDLLVENIRANQQRMEQFQRASNGLQRLAQLLPKGEDDLARSFIDRQLTPDDRAHLNTTKIREIANALNLKLEGFTKLEQARNEEEAAMADYKLTVAGNIKRTADGAMMATSLFTGGVSANALNLIYESGSGYAEGGLKTALIKGVGAASHPASLAISAFEGYRTDGWSGAGQNLAMTYISGKAMQYGLGKALSAMPPKPSATVKEYFAQAQFKQARERGIALAKDFERVNDQATILAALARKGDNAAASKLLQMDKTLREKASAILEDMHAKSYLKYKGTFVTQRGFNKVVDDIHADVQRQWHKIMQNERKWDPTPLKEFRNASSSGSVGMDYDIGLDQSALQTLIKNGKPATLHEWQKEAQNAWNEAFRMQTGRSANRSWETVTTNLHPEAYKDLAWLSQDKSKISGLWAQQAADVTRYKMWHVANDPNLSYMEKLTEISRGASKDISTKMMPLLKKSSPGSAASAEALTEAQRHWERVNNVLDAFGKGQIDPICATRRIRELTGGKSIQEVVTDAATLMESTAKMGSPQK